MIADRKTLLTSMVALMVMIALCYAVLVCVVAMPLGVVQLNWQHLLVLAAILGGGFYGVALLVLYRSANNELALLRQRLQATSGVRRQPAQGKWLGANELSALSQDLDKVVQELKASRATVDRLRTEFEQEVEKRTSGLSRVSAELGEELAKSRRAQKDAQETAEMAARSFAVSPVSQAVMTAREGCFLEVNEAFLSFLGYNREEILNHSDLEVGLWEVQTMRGHLLQQLADRRSVDGIDCRLRTKSGQIRDCQLSVVRLDLMGAPCLALSLQDPGQVSSHDSEDFQTKKMEAVGQLAAGLAHDFNNILMIIQGHTSLLLVEPDQNERSQDSLKHISVATERAAHLTRQLLAFSRKQVMHAKTLDLNALVEEGVNVLHQLLGDNVALKLHLSPRAPLVEADPAMLKEVILDLAANARDALSQGGELVISTSSVAIDSDYVLTQPEARIGHFACLTLSDNGCGMDAATLERIFEPFFTTKEVGKGTGLGLATVYGIVKQHNGWIEASSQPGQGTTFKLFFQASAKAAEAAAWTPKRADDLAGRERILLVEDEPGLRGLLNGILTRYGYSVLPAANGVEAIRIWEEQQGKVDLLLTDMVMPEVVSGQDLAEMLRQRDPSLRVLFTSGYSADILGRSANEFVEGVNFLQKPYRPQNLAAAVRKCLTASEAELETSLS